MEDVRQGDVRQSVAINNASFEAANAFDSFDGVQSLESQFFKLSKN